MSSLRKRLSTAVIIALILCMATPANAAMPIDQAMSIAGVFLEDEQGATAPGWDVLLPEHARPAGDAAHTMIVSAYVRSDNAGLRSILLVQTNLLPSSVGWGPLAACASNATTESTTAYRSLRDLLCGWAQPVAFATPGSDLRLADPVLRALQARDALPAAMAHPSPPGPKPAATWSSLSSHMFGKSSTAPAAADAAPPWLLAGWRISDRHDVLDIQLLVRGDVAPSETRMPLLLARATHAMGDSWRNGQPTEPAMPGAAARAANPFAVGAAQPPAKSFFARTAVTLENWAVAGVALGSSAAGMTVAAVQDAYSAAANSANEYLWDRMSPARPDGQDFLQLVTGQ
jgi:hypothetical protein